MAHIVKFAGLWHRLIACAVSYFFLPQRHRVHREKRNKPHNPEDFPQGRHKGRREVQYRVNLLENIGETDYNPVPPKRSERITMRAKFKGRGKPLPYILDEE